MQSKEIEMSILKPRCNGFIRDGMGRDREREVDREGEREGA